MGTTSIAIDIIKDAIATNIEVYGLRIYRRIDTDTTVHFLWESNGISGECIIDQAYQCFTITVGKKSKSFTNWNLVCQDLNYIAENIRHITNDKQMMKLSSKSQKILINVINQYCGSNTERLNAIEMISLGAFNDPQTITELVDNNLLRMHGTKPNEVYVFDREVLEKFKWAN